MHLLQNLLLSTNDDTAVLKIADFGFARYETRLFFLVLFFQAFFLRLLSAYSCLLVVYMPSYAQDLLLTVGSPRANMVAVSHVVLKHR